jgi:hypothetical protein
MKTSKRAHRAWLLLLLLPVAGFVTLVAVAMSFFASVNGIEKSPGYTLAMNTLTAHAGVHSLLGSPVAVTATKSKHITKTPSSTILNLTFELSGPDGQATAHVIAREKAGRWLVEHATVAADTGRFGLLADGGLHPLYDPKGVLATGP